ncbi:MAG: glycosyl hydrolase [Bacteroidales bacterium]|nr:glycosyl hydrolase [Bacteroidales bacterium]
MERRQFLGRVTTTAALAGSIPFLSSCASGKAKENLSEDCKKIRKAIFAMLSTQRRSWEQGVAAQALLELGEYELVYLLAEEAVLRQDQLGRLANVASDEAVTDPASNGEPVLKMAERYSNEAFREAQAKMLQYLLHRAPRTSDGIIHHITYAPQLWIDSMYMCPPFLAVAGEYDEALRQVEGLRKYLWDSRKKLFSHIWDEKKKTFERKAFWGVGNGWALAGMTRVAHALPENRTNDKERLYGYIREGIDGCLAHVREDGLFHNIIDEPGSFVETNLSQMAAYTIFRGIERDWLPVSYLEAAVKMRKAAQGKMDSFGMVRGVCGSPEFDHPGAATEGQAFYLLMEAAWNDLKKKKPEISLHT